MTNKVKKVLKSILAILVIIGVTVPWFLVYYYYKKQDRKVEIYPKFKIKKVTRKEKVDQNALKSGIKASEEILKRLEILHNKEKDK